MRIRSRPAVRRAAAAGPAVRDELRPDRRARVRARRRATATARPAGASASPTSIPSTAQRPPRRPGTCLSSVLVPWVLGRSFSHPREVFGTLDARARTPHGQGRARDGHLGSPRAARRPAALRGARRAAATHRGRRVDRHPAVHRRARRARGRRARRRATGASRSRSSRAGTIEPVEAIRAKFGGILLMVDANAAYTAADATTLALARRVRSDDDRAAARLR